MLMMSNRQEWWTVFKLWCCAFWKGTCSWHWCSLLHDLRGHSFGRCSQRRHQQRLKVLMPVSGVYVGIWGMVKFMHNTTVLQGWMSVLSCWKQPFGLGSSASRRNGRVWWLEDENLLPCLLPEGIQPKSVSYAALNKGHKLKLVLHRSSVMAGSIYFLYVTIESLQNFLPCLQNHWIQANWTAQNWDWWASVRGRI